jgi:hypothetical protein
MAEVSGAARISPTVPNNAPPAIVTIRTASGWIPSAAPVASNRPGASKRVGLAAQDWKYLKPNLG